MTAPHRDPALTRSLAEALGEAGETAREATREREAMWQLLADVGAPPVDAERAARAWTHVAAHARRESADTTRRPMVAEPTPRPMLRLVRTPPMGTPIITGSAARPVRAPSRATSPSPARRRWLAVATAAALTLVVGGGAFVATATVRVDVPDGGQRTVSLPDGSRATLNAGSSLRHARDFRDWHVRDAAERRVVLDGEGFFDVRRDARPFVVVTRDAEVTVLGTRFDVRAYEGDGDGTLVVVESGRVRVASRGDGASRGRALDLAAGDAARIGRSGSAPERLPVDVERALAWRRGGFTMHEASLAAIGAELSRRFAVSIEVPRALAPEARLSLFYPSEAALETILDDLATSLGFRYRATKDGFAFEPATPDLVADESP